MAELINELFKTHRRPDGREYSNREVARALDNQLDHSYLGKIRSGKIDNPTRNTLLLLCRFFEIEPAYFFPELVQEPPEDEVIDELADQEIADVLARQAAEMSPLARRKLAAFLKVLNKK